jgi:hypothetical protein
MRCARWLTVISPSSKCNTILGRVVALVHTSHLLYLEASASLTVPGLLLRFMPL